MSKKKETPAIEITPLSEVDLYAGGDREPEEPIGDDVDRGDALAGDEPPAPVAATSEADAIEPPAPQGEPEGEEAPTVDATQNAAAAAPPEPPEAETPPPRDLSHQRIPFERFQQVNERRKAAEERAKQLELENSRLRGEAAVPEFDFDAKEEAYMAAVVDGRFDEAKAIRKEIRGAEQLAVRAVADQVRAETPALTEQQMRFQQVVADMESEYPALRSGTSTANEAAINETVELRDMFINSGYTPADALLKASLMVAATYGLEASSAASVAPPAPPAPAPEPRKTNVARNVAVATQQPPAMVVGKPASAEAAFDVFQAGEDEFAALPESTKRRLRGDEV